MARSNSKTRTGARRDIYQTVTDTVIKQLESGAVPWVQPWGRPDVNTPLGMPTNGETGRRYSGVNILLLWGAAIDTQRTTQTWLTYRQAQKLGAQVRKGERGTAVCYADTFTPKAEAERAAKNGDTAQKIGYLKRYTVFNADQCEGLPAKFFEAVEPLPERQIIPRAENLIEATGAEYRIGGDKAFYAPYEDFIQIPPQPSFLNQVDYYRTAFHEAAHWTGHKSRLDRNLKSAFGTKDYAREELTAEMGAAFICAALNITPTVRHSDYLAAWLKVIKEDKRAIFRAASLASKAANFILDFESGTPTGPAIAATIQAAPRPKIVAAVIQELAA